MKVVVFQQEYFQEYVLDFWNGSKLIQNSTILERSQLKSTAVLTNPENNIINFMRIKRIKLPTKRSKTEANVAIEAEFKFLKKNVCTPTRTRKKMFSKDSTDVSKSKRKNLSFCVKQVPKISIIQS